MARRLVLLAVPYSSSDYGRRQREDQSFQSANKLSSGFRRDDKCYKLPWFPDLK
jgi:hypothetical protein